MDQNRDERTEYYDHKEERLKDRTRQVEDLRQRALERIDEETLAHEQEFLIAANKLKVAFHQLEQIQYAAEDMAWVDQRNRFEQAEAELDQAIRLATRHVVNGIGR